MIVAMAARDDADGTRTAALRRASSAILAAGRPPVVVIAFPSDGHNLPRHRPDAVAGAILGRARATAAGGPAGDA